MGTPIDQGRLVKKDSHRRYYLNGALMDEWDVVIMEVRRWSERAGHSRQGHDAKDTVRQQVNMISVARAGVAET